MREGQRIKQRTLLNHNSQTLACHNFFIFKIHTRMNATHVHVLVLKVLIHVLSSYAHDYNYEKDNNINFDKNTT